MNQEHFDIIVVGGGMIGAAFTALLANDKKTSSLKILLIDGGSANDEMLLGDFDPRVVALSQTSRALLTKVGAWAHLSCARVCGYRRMHVWDADGTRSIHFDAADLQADALGHICENRLLVSSLNRVLAEYPSVAQRRGSQVEHIDLADGFTRLVLDNGDVLTATLVVAADGAESSLREQVGLATREWDYDQRAIVTTVRTERSHDFCAWQRFSSDGPLAFLPLTRDGTDAQHCSIVWSLDSEKADAMMALDETDFCSRLAQTLEYRLGKVLHCDQRYAISLRQRHAKNYFKEGIVFVGDAAHTIHPLAGQGANLGFYDIEALFDELVRACDRGVPLSELATLRRYERRRQVHNLTAMAAMETFKRGFGSDNIAIRYLRNEALHFVDKQYLLKKLFSQAAGGYFAHV